MIKTFADSRTEDIYHGVRSARVRRLPADIAQAAVEKLDILGAATDLNDLRTPPGNRLEKLKGDLAGFHGIRVNVQWRIIFKWSAGNATDVQLIDYH